MRSTASAALVVAAALGAVACDDDTDEVDTTITDDPNVPFDPDVPDGVDTDTDEVGNQGFDPDDPGPEGNVGDLPAED